MKVLLPISTEQIISIIPRNVIETSGITNGEYDISMVITMDGEKTKETLNDLEEIPNGNYVDIYFTSTILKEGFGYFIEMKKNGLLYYRDKFYVTSQQDYKVKHKESSIQYKQYNESDDNKYIIR